MSDQPVSEWRIDDQPLDYQLSYWRHKANHFEAEADHERRRKSPANLERLEKEVVSLRAEVERWKNSAAFWERASEPWKRIAERALNEKAELLKDGPARQIAVLQAEIEGLKRRLQNATSRLGDALEHQGNYALLEAEIGCLETSNRALRQRLGGD